VEKPEGKRTLGRRKRRWVDNINIDLGDTVLGGVDWNCLAQDRDKYKGLENAVINIWVP
jgi:hypothetical protein